jgi:hypothetical protein
VRGLVGSLTVGEYDGNRGSARGDSGYDLLKYTSYLISLSDSHPLFL